MEANQEVKLMQEDRLEKLKALTKVMLVSMLWHGAGLLETDKARNNLENANQEKERNTQNPNPSES
jgi:hypothetical protein